MAFKLSIGRISKGLFGITFGTAGAPTFQSAQDWERGSIPTSGKYALTDPYANHATVATAISIKSYDAASIDWEVFAASDTDQPLDNQDHPILRLLDRPAPGMTGYQLFVGTYVLRNLYGEAFWYYPDLSMGISGAARSASRNTGQIHMLDPRRVVDRKLVDGQMHANYRTGVGEPIKLDPDRLTWFHRFNPYSALHGLSELQSVLLEAQGDHAAASWNMANFTDREGFPGGGFITPGENSVVRAEDRQDFLDRLKAAHPSGSRNIGLLPAGWTFNDFGVTQRDIEFRGLREYSREQILAAIGVPPFYAGVLDKANYANAREQKEVYWLGSITRFLTEIQASINSDFLPKIGMGEFRLFPDWESVKSLTENLDEKMTIASSMFAMGFTRRQINERLELGFDVDGMQDADTSYLPFSIIPANLIAAERTPSDTQPSDDTQEPKRLKAAESAEAREIRRTHVWKNIINRTRDLEARMNRVVRSHMQDQQTEVLANLDGVKGWLASNTTKADDEDNAVEALLFNIGKSKERLRRSSRPVQALSMGRGVESIFEALGVSIDWSIDDPVAAAKMAELQYKITRIDDTTEEILRRSLSEGLELGESPQQMAKRVREVMGARKSRSMMIARTEMGQAFSAGRDDGMQRAGVKRHEWLSSRDPKVRDHHVQADGKVVDIGDPFPIVNLRYPLDSDGEADEIINCRCVAIPVLERTS